MEVPEWIRYISHSRSASPKPSLWFYYPFWIVRYAYEGRTYFATVDGITARVVSGRAPGDAGSQSTAAGIGGALSGGAVGLGIGLAIVTEGTDIGSVFSLSDSSQPSRFSDISTTDSDMETKFWKEP